MKTIRYLFTVLMLLCSAVAFAHDFEVDGIYYNITDATNKTVAVTYRGDSYYDYSNEYTADVVIPESVTYNGTTYSVTSIGDYAFRNCTGLTSIVIPNSVTSIGEWAFRGCSSLTKVEFNAENCTTMGSSVFSGCTALSTVTIGENVKNIPDYAFNGCSGLTSIEILNCVTSIGEWAFYNCTGLTSIVIPNSVTSIGEWAFRGCSGLTKVEFNAENCTTMGSSVFSGCTALSTVTIGENVKKIPDYAFNGCTRLTSIEITNSVTSIGNYAFYGSGLTNIEIPNSITSIGSCVFGSCYSLTSIEIPNSVTSIGNYAFEDCTGLTSVVIPNSVISIGDYVFDGCSGLTSVEIGNSVTSIGNYAFYNCSGLTSVEIGNSVTFIGECAFYGCSGLTSIVVDGNNTKYDSRENCNAIIETEINTLIQGCKNTVIPNSVTSIGDYAFYVCYRLTSIEIPNSVTSIGSYAFSGCSGLTSVEIPNSVTSIGDWAFWGCTGLTSVEIGNSVTSIGREAFYGCSGLTSVEIPNSVTFIGESAFSGCSGLTSVEFSAENCTNMGSSSSPVFNRCTALSIVTIGENVKTIPGYAFSGCTGLTSIEIPNSVTSIGDYAFRNCTGLTSIEIPNSVTSIGEDAFFECTGLTNIEIPNSVTSIGGAAFRDCTGLTSITSLIPADKLFAVHSSVFYNVNKNACTLYVPYGAKDAYASTAGWSGFQNIVELRNTYKATFSIDGEVIVVYDIKEGDTIVYPDVDEREGYTLVWTPCIDVMPSENIVIEGTFIVNTYAVTYTVDNEIYATDSIAYGNEIVLRDEPAKEGYTFSGWSEAPETMPANDIVIEGTFSVNTYTVTYTVDGEIYATDSIVYGNEIVLCDEPVKLGYTFSGWSETPKTMPANDIVIEGSFSVNSYTITFVVDGEVYKSMDVEYGAEIPTVAQPVKDGRKFSGWSEIPSTMPAQDVVVEGRFCYTVVFMIGGKYYSSSALYYGDEIIAPSETPQLEGHTFVEWGEFPETMPARDMTIHAIFSVEKYQLMFIIDGEVHQTLFVEYGSEIAYPQKDGYIITWETEKLPQTMPAENLIIIGTSALDTAVECVKDDIDKIVYTIDGHRILDVENLEKGVYIINGKKVLVK